MCSIFYFYTNTADIVNIFIFMNFYIVWVVIVGVVVNIIIKLIILFKNLRLHEFKKYEQ